MTEILNLVWGSRKDATVVGVGGELEVVLTCAALSQAGKTRLRQAQAHAATKMTCNDNDKLIIFNDNSSYSWKYGSLLWFS
uniref:Uncharacterized protein n=1 Tax=Anguilla anguilla TaxID=7936 RepID=A0A0E9SIY7_ANGAN